MHIWKLWESEYPHSVSDLKCRVKQIIYECVPEDDLIRSLLSSSPWEHRRVDSSPAFCHGLRLWRRTDPKLNTVLFISQRPSAKCAASSSLLTSSRRHDWFSEAFFSVRNYLAIHTFPYAHPHSPASDHPYAKIASKQTGAAAARTSTHPYAKRAGMKLKWKHYYSINLYLIHSPERDCNYLQVSLL